jgi:hypothetical protein
MLSTFHYYNEIALCFWDSEGETYLHCPKSLINFITAYYVRWATAINNENFRY